MISTLPAIAVAFALSARVLPGPRFPMSTAIVGRASCGNDAYLLTRAGEFIHVSDGRTPSLEMHVVRELATKPDLWGLACLSDGSVWTLETGHSLARLTRDGHVSLRLDLQLPWIAVFGAGERLLFQALPVVVNKPVLSTALPASLDAVRSWPGLDGRAGQGSTPSVTRNLLRCGIPASGWHPCWFVDDRAIAISDGVTTRVVAVPEGERASLDGEMPVWDVGIGSESRLWILASSPPFNGRRRLANKLLLVQRDGRVARVQLPRAARLLLFAAAARCLLLLESGELAEVSSS
jgi:hypothetical protein